MIPPTSIDGTDITGATIDGTDVTEITVDGDTVFSAGINTQGLIADWDASNFSGGTWTDQGPNGLDLTAVGPVSKVSAGFNGEDELLVNDGDFGDLSFSFPNTLSIFVVMDLNNSGDFQTLLCKTGAGQPRIMFFSDSNDLTDLATDNRPDGNSLQVPTQYGQQVAVFEAGNTTQIRVNGTQVLSSSSDTFSVNGSMSIGDQNNLGRRLDGSSLARLLIYDQSSMAAGQTASVESFLLSKYGL